MDSLESRGSGRLPAEFLDQSQSRTRAPRPPSHQISSRLSAPWSLLQRHSKHRSPRRRSFCAYKRNQNTVKGDRFPLDEPLSVACSAGYERCQGIVRTAHRYAPKVAAGASAPPPSPSPVAGEGPSGQIAACSTHRLDSVTSCNRFAGTKLKCAFGSLSASSNPAPGMRSVSGREGSDA